MSTFSTVPPSLRTTLRNASKDGATVRSSSVGSRMTMISYGRMETSPPPLVCAATVGLWQEGRLRRQPPQGTGRGADRENHFLVRAYSTARALVAASAFAHAPMSNGG